MTGSPHFTPPPPPPPPAADRTSVASRFSRRHFLAGAGVLAAATAGGALAVTRPWQQAPVAGVDSAAGGKLVLVTLYGGNDGLNTVIPYTDPAYPAARPSLGYKTSEVLPLSDGLGLNPKLAGLQSLWKSGNLAIVRGVGYPNPNLSHFASMGIWQTANVEDGSGAGWLGRWLDSAGDGPERAISVGATLPPVLRGEKEAAAAITGPAISFPGDRSFQEAYGAMQNAGQDRAGMAAAVASSGRDLLGVQQRLAGLGSSRGAGASKGAGSSNAGTAPTDLTGALGVVSELIATGSPAQVYQVSLESFDTHATEKDNHERLLADLDSAVTAFFKALKGNPHGADVVLMTYSEFGRRPAENASGGTDHGTAAPLFVAGPKVKGGRFDGEEPSLTDLDANGNLKSNVDFRQVYATALERVVGTDPEQVLGGKFQTLGFV
ncbi:MAG TPA: DUF1501 domain-containing protein [Acidimicrobiales bacterium]|nr:DUF1501 domain-containing protein [Acidimicrobiales bacterium]